MGEKKIFIADGHHRYETMLALRDELRPLASSPRSSIEYASMFLTGMDDPGLVIFPTHRVVHGLGQFDLAEIAEQLRKRFDAQEKQTNLRYVKDFSAALAEARRPGVQAVFLFNPTRIEQLEAVASTGEVMPQKSTFFYPKLASGLVMNPIDPAEEA